MRFARDGIHHLLLAHNFCTYINMAVCNTFNLSLDECKRLHDSHGHQRHGISVPQTDGDLPTCGAVPLSKSQQEAALEIGTYVIVRSSPSGCWAGTLASIEGNTVELTGARRLWRWWAGQGVSLSGVATHGLRADKINDCRIATPVSRALIFEVCEVLSVTATAKDSIETQEAVSA